MENTLYKWKFSIIVYTKGVRFCAKLNLNAGTFNAADGWLER